MFHDVTLNWIFVNENFLYIARYGAQRKKKFRTSPIVGLLSGLTAQQFIITSHKSSGMWFRPCPSGRDGYCPLMVLA